MCNPATSPLAGGPDLVSHYFTDLQTWETAYAEVRAFPGLKSEALGTHLLRGSLLRPPDLGHPPTIDLSLPPQFAGAIDSIEGHCNTAFA
jgi:hypothetical protein